MSDPAAHARLLVAIGPSPFSQRLIRWTHRAAADIGAPWIACHVQTSQPLSAAAQTRMAAHLALARELGAEVLTVRSDNIVEALVRAALQRSVTQIVVGKPEVGRGLPRRPTLVSGLIAQSGHIDVYVVRGEDSGGEEGRPVLGAEPNVPPIADYARALGIVAAVSGLGLALTALGRAPGGRPLLGYEIVGFLELFGVLVVAARYGRGPALAAALASAIAWTALFVEPQALFNLFAPRDLVLIASYFIIAVVAGGLTARVRRQERAARFAAERAMALYSLTQETATAPDVEAVLAAAAAQLSRVFDAQVALLLRQSDGLTPQPHPASTLTLNEKDFAIAQWVAANGRPAGRFTDTLATSETQFRPLRTPNRVIGVVGLRLRQAAAFNFDQELLLETFTNQVALAVEHELLDAEAEQAAMLRESDRLYSALFNSISHELRTPIATIAGAVSSLQAEGHGRPLDTHSRANLIDDIDESARRLNRLVANLLDMSRLESGRLELKLDWGDPADVIAGVVRRFDACFSAGRFSLALAPNLPLVKMDVVLLEQALINLIDNACRYTPPGTPIRIVAYHDGAVLTIVIADQGPGIPAEAIGRVFEKFYRAPGTATGGTGLGLSIVRGLIEAHGGTVSVENAREGGARFTVCLPTREVPPPVSEANP